MNILSPAFKNNEKIPKVYTCQGRDVNPLLQFSEIPQNAKSLTVIVDDPDAPNGTWVHWTLWNIDPKLSEILQNSVPNGSVQGITSVGTNGYHGPCPPSGVHRYFFKIFALDTILNLNAMTKCAQLTAAMEGHIIKQAELVGLYSKVA